MADPEIEQIMLLLSEVRSARLRLAREIERSQYLSKIAEQTIVQARAVGARPIGIRASNDEQADGAGDG